jgi:hypothetical protein
LESQCKQTGVNVSDWSEYVGTFSTGAFTTLGKRNLHIILLLAIRLLLDNFTMGFSSNALTASELAEVGLSAGPYLWTWL